MDALLSVLQTQQKHTPFLFLLHFLSFLLELLLFAEVKEADGDGHKNQGNESWDPQADTQNHIVVICQNTSVHW